MLDLIELTNLEVLFVMGLAFSMGFLFAIVLFFMPAQTKLDTIKRNADREERAASFKRSARAGEYNGYPNW